MTTVTHITVMLPLTQVYHSGRDILMDQGDPAPHRALRDCAANNGHGNEW